MGERSQAARNRVLAQAPKREAVATPFWPEDDGKIYLQDVPQDELSALTEQNKGEDGKVDSGKIGASLLCKALVVLEDDGTYAPLFNYPDDRDTVAHLGTSMLSPITSKVNDFFGFTAGAVASAKNDLEPMQSNSSGIGSQKSAVIVP